MRNAIGMTVVGAALVLGATRAEAVVLYDGGLGTTPSAQGWLFYTSINGGTTSTADGLTNYNSSASNATQGGFSTHVPIINTPVNPLLPSFDLSGQVSVRFDARVISESHASNDRAGLSLIVIGSDLRGIELGFWETEIWAQSGPAFTRAESALVDTTAGIALYNVLLDGPANTYTLSRNGNPILSGSLRNYSSFGAPYSLPNYVFVGDNTTSAGGAFEFGYLGVTVPEPTMLGGLAMAGLLSLRRRRA